MQTLRTYAGVSLISLGLVAVGFYSGKHVSASESILAAQRFVATGKPGFAFDTKLGLECDMDGVDVPKGLTLDIPRCASLANR